MARPIPVNRRWNPDAQAQSPPSEPVAPDPVQVLPPPRVVSAQYEGICHACLGAIELGQQIAQHPVEGLWVHRGCLNRPAIPRGYSLLRARYVGYCNLCEQDLPVGTIITRYQGRWVCAQCVLNRLAPSDTHALDYIEEDDIDLFF